jgi:hypothetical protein
MASPKEQRQQQERITIYYRCFRQLPSGRISLAVGSQIADKNAQDKSAPGKVGVETLDAFLWAAQQNLNAATAAASTGTTTDRAKNASDVTWNCYATRGL